MTQRTTPWMLALVLALSLTACSTTAPNGAETGTTPAPAGDATTPETVVATADAQAPAAPTQEAAAQTAAEAFVEGGPHYVAAAALAEALDAGSVPIQVVDSRAPANFEFGHIPGSINVPYYEPEKHLDKLPKDKWIVTYCECPHAEADQLAAALEAEGYTMVRVIDEGLQGWTALGRTLDSSAPAPTAVPTP